MDEFLEIRRRAIQDYKPKEDNISNRMQEIKDIAEEIFSEIKKTFIEQALNPTIPVLYYEYRNPKRFSGYDSEYVKGYPSRKTLVMIVLQEMCKNSDIVFLHDNSNIEGTLNWQFLKIVPAYTSSKERVLDNKQKTG